ncbi:MAG TPA: urease accessory protein UreE [Polyangiaceae bacterium]|nr:urease accessory protein UreE [Polyangiaceae bacterium]
MLKASRVLSDAATAAAPSDTLTLPFELRQRSRLVASLASGRQIALTLPRGHVLRGGARLQADDGTVIGVLSAAEELSVVPSADPAALLRAAYHLGNRHVALQIEPGALSYLHDHVLDDMLRGLGLEPRVEARPFEPEAGAYGRGGHHHHEPDDEHGHHHHH